MSYKTVPSHEVDPPSVGDVDAPFLSDADTPSSHEAEARSSDQFDVDAPLRSSADQFEMEMDALDYEFQEPGSEGLSNMKMAFMNMANSILGAGIIGQPFAFRNTGLLGGILVMIVLTALIDWTLRLIVMNAHLSQTRTYQDTVAHCFGTPGRILLLLSISSFAYGGCMAFCIIIGDTIPHVLKIFVPSLILESVFGWIFSRNAIIVLFTAGISYPLSLNRDILKLAKASAFALFGMLIIVALTIIRAPFIDPALKSTLPKGHFLFNTKVFQGISVISFALVCHHNTLFIYNSMRNATQQKFDKLTHIACLVLMVCCLVMAINGVLNFGDKTKGNILNNFKSDDNWINVARFCFGLNMLTTFPLEIFVVRDVIKDIMVELQNELSRMQHFTVTLILVFSSMAVALFTCNLGLVLELIGATSASLMAYIIPPLCYLKLSWDQFAWGQASRQQKTEFVVKKVLPCVGCDLFGVLVMLISSYMSIRQGGEGGDGHCVED